MTSLGTVCNFVEQKQKKNHLQKFSTSILGSYSKIRPIKFTLMKSNKIKHSWIEQSQYQELILD